VGAPSSLDKQFAFRSAMRKLWEDHITWTRLYIVSVTADLADKDATAQRLLRNQADIGSAIKYVNADEMRPSSARPTRRTGPWLR